MIRHDDLSDEELKKRIFQKEILFAGNIRLKIYGTLGCQSGKRMKKVNRVFFKNEKDAIELGFRPCKNCKPAK